MKCVCCHNDINYLVTSIDANTPLTMEDINTKGNVYSSAGVREVEISQLCEVCFDEVTLEDEKALEEYRNYLIGA